MRLSLVVLFLAALLLNLPVGGASAQTSRRDAGRKATPPASVKICKGVSIPDGYTIVSETTSTACPDGAYFIKKEREGVALKEGVASTPAAQGARVAQGAPVAHRPSPTASGPRVGTSGPSLNTGVAPTRAAAAEPPVLAGPKAAAPSANPSQPSAAVSDASPLEVDEGDVVRVETNLVTVPVSVFDRQGRFVAGLRREDFRIFENGVEQELAYFEPTEKPFTVALVLDTSASTRFRLSEIQEAAIAFARQLQPQDRVLVVTFDEQVLLLTEATNDRELISTVINVNARTGSSTRLYDAVDLVIKERLSKVKGRKAIVLFTDGVDTSSFIASYESTVCEVEELDALVYPIQYDTYEDLDAATGGSVTITTQSSGWPYPAGGRSSRRVYTLPSAGPAGTGITRADYDRAGRYLGELAAKTGGQLYSADDRPQLAQAFSKIAEELRRQYSLGYYPKTSPDGAGERRQIKVRVERPGLAVRARESYLVAGGGPR